MARNLYVEFWHPADLSSHRSPLLVKEYALPKQFTKIKKKGLKLKYILTPARASTDLLIKARRAKWQKTVTIPFSTILKEYKGRGITDPLRKQTLWIFRIRALVRTNTEPGTLAKTQLRPQWICVIERATQAQNGSVFSLFNTITEKCPWKPSRVIRWRPEAI